MSETARHDAEDQQVIDVLRGQMPDGSTALSPLDVLNLLQEELGQARQTLSREADRIAMLEGLLTKARGLQPPQEGQEPAERSAA